MDKTRLSANLVSENNIFSDITNNKVGIGTTVPTSKLQVFGDATISGIVTASSFSGDITGDATGLSGTPNIAVGFITATGASISGNVSIAGTLTYEDVTNIDSIGIVTARSGIVLGPTANTIQLGTGTTISSPSTNTFTVLTNGSERVRVSSAGSFGLGTNNPSSTLDIFGLQANTSAVSANTPSGTARLAFDGGATAGSFGSSLVFSQRWLASNSQQVAVGQIAGVKQAGDGEFGGGLAFFTSNGSGNSLSERIRIDSLGRVAVGTTAPIAATHIMLSDVTGFTSPANDGLVIERSGGNDLAITIATDNSRNGYLLFADSDSANPAWVGYDHSVNAMSFRVNASERARIDSSGRLLIGTSTSASTGNGYTPGLQVAAQNGSISAASYRSDEYGGIVALQKSKSATVGTQTVVSNNDQLGLLSFEGSDGTNFEVAAQIQAYVDGTPGNNDMPGRLVFSTTADGASNPTARATIDSSGRLLIGTSSARANFFNATTSSIFQVEGNLSSGSLGQVISHVYGENAALGGPYFIFGKHNSASIGGTTLVAANNQLGAISFTGADGSEFVEGARIQAFVDGTPGANDMPGRLVFSTTADGAASPTERMRISSTGQISINSGVAIIDTATSNAPYLSLASNALAATGAELRMGARTGNSNTSAGIKAIHPDGADSDYVSIGLFVRDSGTSTDPSLEIARADYQGSFRPGADNARPLGNASFRWSQLFAGTATINTSDETLKQDVKALDQAELLVARNIKSLIKKFRFKDAVAKKGADARIHVGVIAQEVEQAFLAEGLEPRHYGLFCEDTLEDGSKRLGIRYEELLAFVIAAL